MEENMKIIIIMLLALTMFAQEKTEKMITLQSKVDINIISKWLKLRKVKLKNLELEKITKVKNVKYEGLQNLTRISLNNDNTKYFFFNKIDKLVIIYINNKDELSKLSTKKIIKLYGQPDKILRSRVGKHANHYVYSQKGFAYSVMDKKIEFFEVFPNCSLKEYKKNIYIEPSKFIR